MIANLHHAQVLPEQLSREFQDVRDSIGLVVRNQVSFHEIHSLVSTPLHDQHGWSKEAEQQDLTHSSLAITEAHPGRP